MFGFMQKSPGERKSNMGIATPPAQASGSGLTGAQKLQIIGATLRDLGNPGGGALDGVTTALEAQRAKALREAQMAEVAEKLGGGDQTLQTLLRVAPEAALTALAKRYEPSNLAGGTTRYMGPGVESYTAPMLRFEGDQAITQTPTGINITGTRNPSFAEQTARTQNETQAMLDRLRLDAQIRKWAQDTSLGWANFNERKRQGGFGTPGFGVAGAFVPDADVEIDP